MSKLCEGRVVVVTGAGNGIGRLHALLMAKEGAKVVVNDLGTARDGQGTDNSVAQKVVDEIKAAGGTAVANGDDVSDWAGSKRMIDQAIETFGTIDVVVNNAGFLRDRMFVNMSEQEWDAIMKVHLKGNFAPSHHAAVWWRSQHKLGKPVDARIINTSSGSGLFGNIGQANYGAAKAGIAAMTIIAARELHQYGVTVNALSPHAMTRMTTGLKKRTDEEIEARHPKYVSPIICWLASKESKDITGRVFEAGGGVLGILEGWTRGAIMDQTDDPHKVGAMVGDMLKKVKPFDLRVRPGDA